MSWLPKKTVIVPVDFSPSVPDALRTACELAGGAAGVHVLHVLAPQDYMDSNAMIGGSSSEQERESETRSKLAALVSEQQAAGAHLIVRFGDAAREVTTYAREVRSDLIVIPSHGYHGMKRLLLGSVAEEVIRHADCAVLVLRRHDAE